MKILLVNLWRVIDSKGGTEKVFFSMANALTERGFDVVAIGLENKKGIPFFNVNENVKFINVGLGFTAKLSIMERIQRSILFKKEDRHDYDKQILDKKKSRLIYDVIENEKPDIIISFNVEATKILKYDIRTILPVITMFHFDPETILNDAPYIIKETLEKSECIQVLLPSYIGITRKHIENNNIIDIGNVVNQVPNTYIEKSKVLINIGRFEKNQKRQHLLIEAFNLIKDTFPDWRVCLWGELCVDVNGMEYSNYCKRLVKKYGLENRVYFCGTTNKVQDELEKAAIFACTSAYEGFGLALTEAMSVGLPCVGFKNCPAVNELIKDDSNGILCDDNVEDLARGLSELMEDADKRKRYGLQAKEDMKQYAPEKIWNQWENLINETVREHKKKIIKK